MPYKKCAIFKLDSLGDAVLALGAIDYITKRNGVENCVLVCWSNVAELVNSVFPKLEIVPVKIWRGKLWRILVQFDQNKMHPLFQDGVEQLISLRHHRSLAHDIIFSAIPANITIGTPPTCLSDFEYEMIVTSMVNFDRTAGPIVQPAPNECFELASHRAVLMRTFDCLVRPSEVVPRFLSFRPPPILERVIVAPYASAVERCLNVKQLKPILAEVQRVRSVEVVVIASPQDEVRLTELVEELSRNGIMKLSWRCTRSLMEMMDTFAEGGVLLAPESGPAHVAVAMDMAAVILLGGGHYGWFAPWRRSDRQVWVTHAMPCYGCKWRCIHPEVLCLTAISQELVATSVAQLLQHDERTPMSISSE